MRSAMLCMLCLGRTADVYVESSDLSLGSNCLGLCCVAIAAGSDGCIQFRRQAVGRGEGALTDSRRHVCHRFDRRIIGEMRMFAIRPSPAPSAWRRPLGSLAVRNPTADQSVRPKGGVLYLIESDALYISLIPKGSEFNYEGGTCGVHVTGRHLWLSTSAVSDAGYLDDAREIEYERIGWNYTVKCGETEARLAVAGANQVVLDAGTKRIARFPMRPAAYHSIWEYFTSIHQARLAE